MYTTDIAFDEDIQQRKTLMEPRTMLPRLFILGALATGVIGRVGSLTDETWKLGPTSRFTSGTLLAILSLINTGRQLLRPK